MTTAHFNHWKNEYSDMPTKGDDGIWFDMEDGLAYDSSANYGYSPTPKRTAKQEAARQISLNKAKEARKLAKFYGGKALTGSAKQKSWGESIRNDVLASSALTDEQKETLLQAGGFTQTAGWWIDNKDVPAKEFTAENIVAQYRGLTALEDEFINNRSNVTHIIEKQVAAVVDYINTCTFKFKTSNQRVQDALDKAARNARRGRR